MNTIKVSNSLDPDQARHFVEAWSGSKLFAKGRWHLSAELTHFLLFTTAVVCSLICLYTLIAYIENTMGPDHYAPKGAILSGFIVFAFTIKVFWSALEYMQQTYKAEDIFMTKFMAG